MKETNESIKKNQEDIKSAWCTQCIYCTTPSFDYEWWYTEPWYCNKEWNQNYWNLKSFPFKKHKKCFSPDLHFLIYLDKDLTELDDKASIKDFSTGVAYNHNIINKDEKTILEKKTNEIINKMHKLAKERYWF